MADIQESFPCPSTGEPCDYTDFCSTQRTLMDGGVDEQAAELARNAPDGPTAEMIRSPCSKMRLDGLARLMAATRDSFVIYSVEDLSEATRVGRSLARNPDITNT